jgi:hypothetical protein
VKRILAGATASGRFQLQENREVAFYGGTFTGLPISQMEALLEAAYSYLKRGLYQTVRVSTRPDALDENRLDLLARYGVRTVELGAQSMEEEVLSLSRRGHSAQDTAEAVALLRRKGFRVGIQLMPGLPGDTPGRFRSTIDQVLELAPDTVRLYPTVVIAGTTLAAWYRRGGYVPMGLEDAVQVCVEACFRLETAGVAVIRIGLMSSPDLESRGRIVAGPWHPSFGLLVRSGVYHKAIESQLPRPGKFNRILLRVPPREIPLVRGFRNQGIGLIQSKTGARVVAVEGDDGVPRGRIAVVSEEKNGRLSGSKRQAFYPEDAVEMWDRRPERKAEETDGYGH